VYEYCDTTINIFTASTTSSLCRGSFQFHSLSVPSLDRNMPTLVSFQLAAIVSYCQLLSAIVSYCQLLLAIASYCELLLARLRARSRARVSSLV
jgi:hypothetical protein